MMRLSTLSLLIIAIPLTFQSCKKEIVNGCTDETAKNYDESANFNDGTCTYVEDRYIGSIHLAFSNASIPGLTAYADETIGVPNRATSPNEIFFYINLRGYTAGQIIPDTATIRQEGSNWIFVGNTFTDRYFGGATTNIIEHYVRSSVPFALGDAQIPLLITRKEYPRNNPGAVISEVQSSSLLTVMKAE